MIERRPRFLIVISDFDISQLMFNIIKSFQVADIDFELIFISDHKTWLIAELEKIGIKGRRISRSSKLAVPRNILKIFIFILEKRITGIYLSGQLACLIGLIASFLARVPRRIFTRHHSDSNYSINSRSLRLLRARYFDIFCNLIATKIIAVSPLVYNLLVTYEHANPSKVTTISNSIPKMYKREDEAIYKERPFTIGVISRMTEIKGVEYIAEAFCNLQKNYPNCNLLIVGEKSDSTDRILEILDRAPADKFKIVNKVYDIATFYRSIDAFVHVPIRQDAEAFGLVYLEALFSGVPCVFTESGILKNDEDLKKLCQMVNYKSAVEIQVALESIIQGKYLVSTIPCEVENQFSTSKMVDSYIDTWIE